MCRSQSPGCSDQGLTGADRALPTSHTHTPDLPTLGKHSAEPQQTTIRSAGPPPALHLLGAAGREENLGPENSSGAEKGAASPTLQPLLFCPSRRQPTGDTCRPPPPARPLSHVSVLCPAPAVVGVPSPLSPPQSQYHVCNACLAPAAAIRWWIRDIQADGRLTRPEGRGPPMRLECVMVVPRILGFHARQPSGRKGSWGFCCSSVMSCLENPELEPEERHKHCAAPPCLGLPTRPAVCVCPIAGSSSGSSGGSSVRARHDWNCGGRLPRQSMASDLANLDNRSPLSFSHLVERCDWRAFSRRACLGHAPIGTFVPCLSFALAFGHVRIPALLLLLSTNILDILLIIAENSHHSFPYPQ